MSTNSDNRNWICCSNLRVVNYGFTRLFSHFLPFIVLRLAMYSKKSKISRSSLRPSNFVLEPKSLYYKLKLFVVKGQHGEISVCMHRISIYIIPLTLVIIRVFVQNKNYCKRFLTCKPRRLLYILFFSSLQRIADFNKKF